MTGAGFGLLLSLTIAISAAIGAVIGAVATASLALFWRRRAEQLAHRLSACRSNGREAELFFPQHRRGRAGRSLETTSPD